MATDNFRFAQLQTFYLAGGGASIGDTSITLASMLDIDGNALSMSGTFGTIGFGTLEAGNGNLEEQISFTGLTNNSNGTVTLSGVSNVAFEYPYTKTSGLLKTHAGSATFVISNTSGFYDEMTSKDDDETVNGLWTFPNGANTPQLGSSYVAPTLNNQVASKGYADSLTFAGAPNATTSQKGIVQLATQAQVDAKTATGSTGASLTATPDLARSTLLSDYVADTGTANTYAIAPSPAVTAYATGQVFTFKASHVNTTASTLNVNTLGAKSIFKNGSFALAAGDIANGGVYAVEYDGTQFQLLSQQGKPQISQSGIEIFAADGGSTDAYAVTLVPAPAAYTTGMVVNFTANTLNTGGATLNVNTLGAKTLVKNFNVALVTGDILAGQAITAIYDGTNFQMQSPVASAPKYAVGSVTKNTADSSTTQTIAHGLGVVPKFVRFDYLKTGAVASDPAAFQTIAEFDGTNTAAIYASINSAGGNGTVGSGFLLFGADTSVFQTGVISVDATNISIAWTKTGSPTGTYTGIWKANS